MKTISKIITKVDTRRGAPMGRHNTGDNPQGTVFDSAVPMSDGAYDKGGAYWGLGAQLRVRYTKDLKYIHFYRQGDKMPPIEPVTKVIFRMFNEEVIALFPDMKEHHGLIGSYMHIGQHGAADYNLIVSNSRLATESEYEPLKQELINIGYNLRIMKRG